MGASRLSGLLIFALLPSIATGQRDRVCVHGTLGAGLHVRAAPCSSAAILGLLREGEAEDLVARVNGCDGQPWLQITTGFVSANYTQLCGGAINKWNRYALMFLAGTSD